MNQIIAMKKNNKTSIVNVFVYFLILAINYCSCSEISSHQFAEEVSESLTQCIMNCIINGTEIPTGNEEIIPVINEIISLYEEMRGKILQSLIDNDPNYLKLSVEKQEQLLKEKKIEMIIESIGDILNTPNKKTLYNDLISNQTNDGFEEVYHLLNEKEHNASDNFETSFCGDGEEEKSKFEESTMNTFNETINEINPHIIEIESYSISHKHNFKLYSNTFKYDLSNEFTKQENESQQSQYIPPFDFKEKITEIQETANTFTLDDDTDEQEREELFTEILGNRQRTRSVSKIVYVETKITSRTTQTLKIDNDNISLVSKKQTVNKMNINDKLRLSLLILTMLYLIFLSIIIIIFKKSFKKVKNHK